MKNRKGFTRIDLIVVVACVVFILANVPIILAGGRQHAKRDVCMANLRELAGGWQMFTDDNNGKIPSGDIWYSWIFPGATGTATGPQLAWHEWPHPSPHSMPPSRATNHDSAYQIGSQITDQAWKHAIAEGLLWNYVKDYDIYKCPMGNKGSFITYSMAHSMNTYPNSGGTTAQPCPTITNRSQITQPAQSYVFLDTGTSKRGAFFVSYSSFGGLKWGDLPPMRHNQGTTFSFADGHAVYRKWTDPHALNPGGGWGGGSIDNCDCDLRWITKATWGKILYDCTDPNKNCED